MICRMYFVGRIFIFISSGNKFHLHTYRAHILVYIYIHIHTHSHIHTFHRSVMWPKLGLSHNHRHCHRHRHCHSHSHSHSYSHNSSSGTVNQKLESRGRQLITRPRFMWLMINQSIYQYIQSVHFLNDSETAHGKYFTRRMRWKWSCLILSRQRQQTLKLKPTLCTFHRIVILWLANVWTLSRIRKY